jgi:hypothetical protein
MTVVPEDIRDGQRAIRSLLASIRTLQRAIAALEQVLTSRAVSVYSGSRLYSDEHEPQFLGTVASSYSSDSIFNAYGTYGSKYSSDSIWNTYGTYGSKYSSYSPFNEYTSSPPVLIKNQEVIGRLTVNEHIAGAVDPFWLKRCFTGDTDE